MLAAVRDGGCSGIGLDDSQPGREESKGDAYRDAIRVLLTDTLGLGLALLEGVLVLELAAHFGDGGSRRRRSKKND